MTTTERPTFDISLMGEEDIRKLELLGFERQGQEIALPDNWTGVAGGGEILMSAYPHTSPESWLLLCDETGRARIKVVDLRLSAKVGKTTVKEASFWDRILVRWHRWLH